MLSFKLILQNGMESGTEYSLNKPELFLGRDPVNDIVINDPEVSRRHARLLQAGDSYSIEDLGSTNGTFIRGQRLAAPVTMLPGELITLGERIIVKFEVTGLDANATVAAFRAPAQPVQTPAVPQVTPPVSPFIPSQPAAPVIIPPEPPVTPPQPAAPVYVPPQPSAPVYQTPQPSVPAYIPPQPEAPIYRPIVPPAEVVRPVSAPGKKKSGWLVALLVVVGILLVFCVIPWVIIELTNSYCALFPGIFNAIQPGACP